MFLVLLKCIISDMTERNRIEVESSKFNGSKFFDLVTEHGRADLTLNTAGWLWVSNIDVDVNHRRKGIGKSLLEKTREIAIEQQARVICAALISRESIVLFGNVFGEENLTIHKLGEFTDEQGLGGEPASAALWYRMPKDFEIN